MIKLDIPPKPYHSVVWIRDWEGSSGGDSLSLTRSSVVVWNNQEVTANTPSSGVDLTKCIDAHVLAEVSDASPADCVLTIEASHDNTNWFFWGEEPFISEAPWSRTIGLKDPEGRLPLYVRFKVNVTQDYRLAVVKSEM